MPKVTLYTIHCAKCEVLQKKLDAKGIQYDVVDNIEVMKEKGYLSAPILEVDGKSLKFPEAITFVNNYNA